MILRASRPLKCFYLLVTPHSQQVCSQDPVIPDSLPNSSSTATNDLLGLDFSSFAAGPAKVKQANGQPENWSRFESNPYNPFSNNASKPPGDASFPTYSPALSPFISSNPFVSGQTSAGSSKNSSPSKTPHKLSPEKLNPFKVNQVGNQTNYNLPMQQSVSPAVINSTNRQSPVHNLQNAALYRSSVNQSLPVRNQFSSNQNSPLKTTGLGKSSLPQQTNNDNELFSDLLGSWKTREGL